ncbi:MAG: heavy-metal-associated domain-containing protein [Collinsella sp.]
MSDLLNPANLSVLAVIVVGMFFGLRRIVASTHGKSCCSDGASGKKAKKVVVTDTDPSHYPYSDELLIGGMSCDGCAQNVENALIALDGVWATVTYADHTARARSKRPIDRGVLETAVRDAGYYVMKL